MGLISASIISTDSTRQLMCRKQAIRLDHIALAMDPLGLNWVEPGASGWQQEGQNAYAFVRLLDGDVVFSDPGAHHPGFHAKKHYPRSATNGVCLVQPIAGNTSPETGS